MSDKEKIRAPEPEITRKKQVPTKEFGLLKVWEWPDGTVVHLNTKKGEENLRIYHSSGTFDEYGSNGTRVQFNANNQLNYSKGGVTVTFDNNSDTKGSGHARLSIDHDSHIEVKKNASIAVAGTADIVGIGHVKVAATDLYLGSTKGSIVLNAARDIEIKGKGRVLIDAGRVMQLTAKGDIHAESEADVKVIAGENIEQNATGNYDEKAGQNITSNAGRVNFVRATGNVKTKGDKTIVQEGGAQLTPTSSDFV